MRFIKNLLLSFVGFSLFISFVIANTGTFSIAPANPSPPHESWFVYSLRPGDSFRDEVLVKNFSDSALVLSLYSVDSAGLSPGDPSDSFSLKSKDAEMNHIGKWVTLSESIVTLDPNSSKTVSFSVTVPDGTPEKEYSGGIVAHYQSPISDAPGGTDTKSVNIDTRVGVRMYLTVDKNVLPPQVNADKNLISGTFFWPILLLVVAGLVAFWFFLRRSKKSM